MKHVLSLTKRKCLYGTVNKRRRNVLYSSKVNTIQTTENLVWQITHSHFIDGEKINVTVVAFSIIQFPMYAYYTCYIDITFQNINWIWLYTVLHLNSAVQCTVGYVRRTCINCNVTHQGQPSTPNRASHFK